LTLVFVLYVPKICVLEAAKISRKEITVSFHCHEVVVTDPAVLWAVTALSLFQ